LNLMIDRTRLDGIQARYLMEIEEAVDCFGDHEGIGTAKIARWLSQFREPDLPLALKILENIVYFSTRNVRICVRELVNMIQDHFTPTPPEEILYITVGNPQEGSAVIARALRDYIDEERIKHMAQLEKVPRGTYQAVAFLDDFAGTGEQVLEWWDNVSSLVLPKEVPFALGLLAVTSQAAQIIRDIMPVIPVNVLENNRNIFSLDNTAFSAREKLRIREYCDETHSEPEFVEGYGHCGLLLAFKHGCPDNSLPILWKQNEYWEHLFKRSAL
jgi:hypothetical protein